VARNDEESMRWRWALRHLRQEGKALREDDFCDVEDETLDVQVQLKGRFLDVREYHHNEMRGFCRHGRR
jgi:hypothetical protein